ncbi:MAG: FAD-binding oxidoreductase [Mesorhizobium sp.]|uniref:NAD(P)/FAD-dependent oxidoreductase n=3 Tax=Mesorhizobium TaxID=68287 RepID=UPI0008009E35|nr:MULTISPECIES: FAD-binding oxidoreductase [unclassified Mesorhizobium]TGV92341.1 FAD-binding oxidoreductase [Mesorhizobium sp. M00.F.Ca.ET.158.01.1.1]AZO58236.1 FAD-binding oxidoreductase [Mesorhizobium sp. M1A.F.Ca.IN.022.06.1.1]MCT2580781.1 FAD-binding oxidoreductase [Mesorhizobium sp. P13.3]MDF3169915.1 FAD-binding oxidoreductase [Mesorhizobium sp. P16.1]MDF3179839.1 FAD-binding oxidoreductase [Mesorhizobium sp. P17.1]
MTADPAGPFKSTPYWWEDCTFSPLPVRRVASRCDVAIVGGGYAGLSAAIELARAGRSVQLFDRQSLGQAASSRNGGMASGSIRPGRKELIRRFGEARATEILMEGKAAREDLWAFLNEEKVECDFHLSGLFVGAINADECDELSRSADLLRRFLGIEAHPVGRLDVPTYIGTDFYTGGFVRMDTGGLHPAKLLAGIIRVAMATGAVIHENTAVTGTIAEAGGVRVRTSRGDVLARKVLICTDAYTDGFDPWLRRRIVPVRSRIIATEPLAEGVMDQLMPKRMMYGDMRQLSYYYRPSADGSRILFGGRDGTTAGDALAPTTHLRSELGRIFPELRGVGLTHSWFGQVAMHRDMVPRIFTSGDTVYATGFCGSGVVWARWLGKKAAFKILGETEKAQSAFDFDPAPKAVPFYRGKPWFIPLVYSLYEWRDKRAMRRRQPEAKRR